MTQTSQNGAAPTIECASMEVFNSQGPILIISDLYEHCKRIGVKPEGTYTYKVRASVAPNGEVHPLLVDPDGLPIWWPNLWLLTAHRNRGAAYGTLATYCTLLARLYTWAQKHGLKLDQRILTREWLIGRELESLAIELSVQVRGVSPARPPRTKPGNIEQYLRPKVSGVPLITSPSIAARLNLVADYLLWLGSEGVNRASSAGREKHKSNLNEMIEKIKARIPICHGYNKGIARIYDRVGVLRLLEVTIPGHPENPFCSPEIQLRNHLIVTTLFTFGLRIGELGGLKVKDIDVRAQVLVVARRPCDPEDPRGRYAMHQKTRARVMALELTNLIQTYKQKVRNRHDNALNHPFLFVSEQDGRPISMSALEKIFRTLRAEVSGLPNNLTPHYLRHAWNYEWSKVCKAKGIHEDEAEQLRNYLMGWKMSSNMKEVYNQPYIQELADECSLEVQKRMWSMGQEAKVAFDRMKAIASKATIQGTDHE